MKSGTNKTEESVAVVFQEVFQNVHQVGHLTEDQHFVIWEGPICNNWLYELQKYKQRSSGFNIQLFKKN